MRNRFVADIGDFGKYGLLRALARGLAGCADGKPSGLGDGEQPQRLGAIWYWLPDTDAQVIHPDGPHLCQQAYYYICRPSALEQSLRLCDEDLFNSLRAIVIGRQRSVADAEQSGALPEDTVVFRDEVPADYQDRLNWLEDAIAATLDCDLVFLDPDNGLEPVDNQGDQALPVHARHQDTVPFWDKGKSLVIYQHLNSNGNIEEQVRTHAANLRYVLGLKGPPGDSIALVFHRRISRVFFVIPNAANPEVSRLLRGRIDSFLECCWGAGQNPHFSRVDC